MAYVPVPKDLTKVKTKVAFNLTKRQLICFGGGAVLGIPLFFLLKGPLGSSAAAMCMILVMLPFFMLGIYEKNSTSQVVGGSTVNNSTQTNVTAGKGPTGTTAPRQPHPVGSAASTSPSKPGKARSTKRESTGAVPKTPAAPSTGSSQPDSAGKPARSTQRPPDPAPRPGRNVPPATAAPPAGGTSSGTVRQERTSSPSRAAVSGTSPSPARQEQRKPAAPTSPSMKGDAPNVRPGPAGTAQTGKQAASTKRPAAHSSKRANPVRRPAPRNRGGTGRG